MHAGRVGFKVKGHPALSHHIASHSIVLYIRPKAPDQTRPGPAVDVDVDVAVARDPDLASSLSCLVPARSAQ